MTTARTSGAWTGALAAALVLVLAAATACERPSEESPPLPGRAEMSATVDRAGVAFGDDLTLTLVVESDPSLEVELPHVAELEGFRILDAGTTRDQRDGVRVERRWHRLRAERAGTLTLPVLTARYRRPPASGSVPPPAAEEWTAISTDAIAIEVRSRVEAGQDSPEIRDIKPLQPIARTRPWLWVAVASAAVLVLAAGMAYWLRRRRREGAAAPPVEAVPAHEVALAALARLAAVEPVGEAAMRRFYFSVSEIVRAYVEGRFGLNATDLTSEEIVAALPGLGIADRLARGLSAFLADTDRVKFAAQRPERDEIAAILQWARRFVEETRPVETGEAPSEVVAREAA